MIGSSKLVCFSVVVLTWMSVPSEGSFFNSFGKILSKVEKSVVDSAKKVDEFYEEHKTLIDAGALLILDATGVGEVASVAEVIDLLSVPGNVDEMFESAELVINDMDKAKMFKDVKSLVDSLKHLKDLYSSTSEVGDQIHDSVSTIMKLFEKKDSLFKRHPHIGAPLLLKVAHTLAISKKTVNSKKIACEMADILPEYLQRTLHDRLEQLSTDEEFAWKLELNNAVNKELRKKESGISQETDPRCDNERGLCKTRFYQIFNAVTPDEKCFVDKYGAKPMYCTCYFSCPEQYMTNLHHHVESMFPIKFFNKLCGQHNTREPNGSGHLTIKIKYFLSHESGGDYTYPNFKIFTGTQNILDYNSMEHKQGVLDRVPVDKYAELDHVSKDSRIKFQTIYNRKLHPLEGTIRQFLDKQATTGINYSPEDGQLVELALFWSDEYRPKPGSKKN